MIDGKKVLEDMSINEGSSVTISDRASRIIENQTTLLLNKPSGYYCRRNPKDASVTITRKLMVTQNRDPLCMLNINPQKTNNLNLVDDIPSQVSGLLLYSQSGLLSESFTHPESKLHCLTSIYLESSTRITDDALNLIQHTCGEHSIVNIVSRPSHSIEPDVINIVSGGHSYFESIRKAALNSLKSSRIIRRAIFPLSHQIKVLNNEKIGGVQSTLYNKSELTETELLNLVKRSLPCHPHLISHNNTSLILLPSAMKAGTWTLANPHTIKKLIHLSLDEDRSLDLTNKQ